MMHSRVRALVLVAFVGCAVEAAPEEAEVQATITEQGNDLQGNDLQGNDLQGNDLQGNDLQGTSYEGAVWKSTSLQGASYGTAAPYDASLKGTALAVWVRRKDGTWEQRFPNRICYWDLAQKVKTSCTSVTPSRFTPSPLAGASFRATFRGPAGEFQGTIRIGTSTTDTSAVRSEPRPAMFPLKDHEILPGNTGTACGAPVACDHPDGCRKNCDLWLYDIHLVDVIGSDGQLLPPHQICPSGEATAVAGVYSSNGTRDTVDATKFTFACTGGTIAKCTRWGFRPFGSATKTCTTNCGTNPPPDGAGNPVPKTVPLADLHQSCIRAAMADYCARGESWTKTGTLIDIWDYNSTHSNAWGFIPVTRGGTVADGSATALVYESTFDKYGALYIDHKRYAELSNFGDDFTRACVAAPTVDGEPSAGWARASHPDTPYDQASMLQIHSTTACAHSELARGRWLHGDCSACTRQMSEAAESRYCTDPSDPRGWDAECVWRQTVCDPEARMTSHGECVTGSALRELATGCTAKVCRDPAHASCCDASTGAWTSACVTAANAICTGGREGVFGMPPGVVGFCGTSLTTTTSQ